MSELDSQASAIKHTRTSTESSLSGPSIHSDRRQRQCCLCSCLQRGAREVHRFHAQLSWRARARTTLDPRLLRARRTIRRRIAPRGVCLSSRVGAHRQCNCRPQLGMLFTSVLNGCWPSWPNSSPSILYRYSLFLPSLSSTASEKQDIFEMPLRGGPRQILAALPVVAAPSIISTDARKHPVPTAQETPQPHRREDPCLCGLPLRSACRCGAPLDSGAGVFHDNTPLGRNVDSGSG